MLCEGLDLGNAKILKGTSANLCCLLFPLSFGVVNSSRFLFLATRYHFCSLTHPPVQFIGCTWPRCAVGGRHAEPQPRLRYPPWPGPGGTGGTRGCLWLSHSGQAALCRAQNCCSCGTVVRPWCEGTMVRRTVACRKLPFPKRSRLISWISIS